MSARNCFGHDDSLVCAVLRALTRAIGHLCQRALSIAREGPFPFVNASLLFPVLAFGRNSVFYSEICQLIFPYRW